MANPFSSAVGSNSTTSTATSNLHTILNTTIEQEEDAIAADVISMDALIADNAEWRDSYTKALGILRSTSGITSVISSSIFIWMIMRSYDRLSTTQHRLLLGLCISDIISSLIHSTFNIMAPSDNDYMTWNARGDQDTCTAQGFLVTLGIGGGLFYNASLNLYFLAVVKYKKNEEFIRAKIEPFLHGVTIATTFSHSIHMLVRKHYNDNWNGLCIWPINDAPHCQGFDVGKIREDFEIPCWLGAEGALTAGISNLTMLFIPVLIMIVSLGTIYSAVRTQEKKLARYGVGALRSNDQQQSVSTEQSSGVWGRISTSLTALLNPLKARTCSCRNINKPVTRSNNVQSQSRAVMHKAFGFTFAWFLSYGFFLIGTITQMATGSYPRVHVYLTSIFGPLQGFFNLLIFMHPKIMAAKKSKKRQGGETVSWCHAFSTAFWSRGKGDKNQGTNTSNLRAGGTSNRRQKTTKNEDASSDNVTSPMFGRIKKKKKRADTPQEEEKCEIQVPDNMNPNKTRAMYSATSTATYAPNIVPSTGTATMRTANRMKKVNFEENVDVGNTLSDIVEDPDKHTMRNQDVEEEDMEEIEEENMDIVSMAAGRPVSADVKEQKEIMN